MTVINDDARHFLRTTTKRYDLVVFALIDSLTMQSSFSGVRLESYMFTEESFRAVRDRLRRTACWSSTTTSASRGWSIGWPTRRLSAFGAEPRVHVHEARAYLGVMLAGPRLATLTADPVVPDRVTAFGQSHAPSPARLHHGSGDRAGNRRLAVSLHARTATCLAITAFRARPDPRACRRWWCWPRCGDRMGRLVVGVLPARRRVHAARDEVDHPVRAAVGLDLGCRLAGHRRGADDGAHRELDRARARDHASLAGGRSAAGAAGAELRHPGRPGRRSRAAWWSRCSMRR